MPCFSAIAQHLAVLIHDESPLGLAGRRALAPGCRLVHRSWVANLVPFAAPFREEPEEKILFLGSKLGLTPHRQRQIDFLAHSASRTASSRAATIPRRPSRLRLGLPRRGRLLSRGPQVHERQHGPPHPHRPAVLVGLPGDGAGQRGFAPRRPPRRIGRRGPDLALPPRRPAGAGRGAERALAATSDERRRVYEHCNRHETVGAVVAEAIHAAGAGSA